MMQQAMKRLGAVAAAVAVVGEAPSTADAIDRHVPAEYGTIQAAVDASVDGDVIVVAPGTYGGGGADAVIDPGGRAITIVGSGGAAETIITTAYTRRGIVCTSGETTATRFAGLTLRANHAPGFGDGCGALIVDASATFEACVFEFNGIEFESDEGGAIAITNGTLILEACTFFANHAYSSGGAVTVDGGVLAARDCDFTANRSLDGGAVALRGVSTATIERCAFTNNEASDGKAFEGDGGALNVGASSRADVSRCSFRRNRTYLAAGAILNAGTLVLDRSTFLRNTTDTGGGAIDSSGTLSITRSTFVENSGFASGGGLLVSGGAATIAESLLCENQPDDIAGPWTDGGDVTIGACGCLGDVNGDGAIDFLDLVRALSSFGPCPESACPTDVTRDGVTGATDIQLILLRWGAC